jgi:uncharacterized protein DUF1573
MRQNPVMKKNLLLRILTLILFLSFFLVPATRAADTSLETQLKARVTEFWTAWSRGEFEKVDLLVREEGRPAFAKVPRFQVTEFKIDSVVLGPDSKSAVVRTKIKRMLPMSATPLDWTVENQWVYEKGDWYLQYAQNQQPADPAGEGPSLFRPAPTPPQPPPPNEITFDSTTFDFGTVPPSTVLHHVFSFENRGTRPLRLVHVGTPCQGLFATPECIGVVAHSDGSFFNPGDKGKIEAQWQNALTPGKVDETIELYFNNGQFFNLRFVGIVTEAKAPKR